jgi:Flp pilus assembly protein TadD
VSATDQAAVALERAKALCDLGRFEEAANTVSQVIASDPRNAYAWGLMAQSQLGLGRNEPALSAARAASSINPDEEWPHRLSAYALARLQRPQEAVSSAREAVRLAPHAWITYFVLSQALIDAKETDQARSAADRAVELAPDEARPHLAVGAVAVAQKRRADAERAYRRALTIDPQNTFAQNRLAALKIRGRSPNSLADAAKGFASAAATNPQQGTSRHGLELAIGKFMSMLAYFVWLDAFLLAGVGAHISRPIPVLILAVPGIYGVRFVARLTPSLRHYTGQTLLRHSTLKVAGGLEALAVACIVGSAIATQGARGSLGLLAAVAALAARIFIFTRGSLKARELGHRNATQRGNRNLTFLALALGAGALASLHDALTTNPKTVSAVWAIGLALACGLAVRARLRRSG